VLSSHLVADLERVCDYLIVLAARGCASPGRSRSCWPPTTCCRPAPGPGHAAGRAQVISASHTDQARHAAGAQPGDPASTPPGPSPRCLEDLVLAYHEPGHQTRPPRPGVQNDVADWRRSGPRPSPRSPRWPRRVLPGGHRAALASLYAASGITGCHGQSCGQLASSFLIPVGAASTRPCTCSASRASSSPRRIASSGSPADRSASSRPGRSAGWTQSITRTRWLAVKLALTGLAAIAVTGGAQPHPGLVGRTHQPGRPPRDQQHFPTRHGPAQPAGLRRPRHHPARLRAFAFTLGVTAGVLSAAIPAMALPCAISPAVGRHAAVDPPA